MTERSEWWSGLPARVRRWVRGPLRDAVRRVVPRPAPLRRLGRWSAVGLALVVPCAIWGVASASARGNVGPHIARYEVTLDADVTVDVGPLGTLVIDSPLPGPLGARIVIQEIPREATSIEASTTLDSLARDLEEYIQFFTAPEATVEVAARAVVIDAVRRAVLAVVVVGGLLLALRASLGERRRTELREAARRHRVALAGTATVTVLVVGVVTASQPLMARTSAERIASSVFDGTPLEGARITGRLAGVIDTYGGQAVNAYRENEAFYAAATESVRVAWVDRMAQDDAIAAATDDAAEPTTELIAMVVVSDLHCNVGMTDVISAVAELSGARIVLDAGDITANGTAVESYCVTAFAHAVPDGATMVVATGNHDSTETVAQARQAGIEVLDGEVRDIEGVRILGDVDPRATRVGGGTTLTGDETLADVAERLAAVACDDGGVDLLLVHDPVVGAQALEEGCVSAQVSGHLHRRVGPLWVGNGTQYVSSSTAGATLGSPTIGPLAGIAELTVLRFDPESGRIVDYRLVRVMPDTSATVGPALTWPGVPSAPVPNSPFR